MIENIETNLINEQGTTTKFNVENVNIFVGSNSSGKSLFLYELNRFFTNENENFSFGETKILNKIQLFPLSLEKQLEFINSFGNTIDENSYHGSNWETIDIKDRKRQVSRIFNALNEFVNASSRTFYYDSFFTLFLNGSTRLNLLTPMSFSPYSESNSVYYKLYHDHKIYDEFKKYIKEAFNFHTFFKIDGSSIEFAFSRVPAPNGFDEFSLKPESVNFLSSCMTQQDLSDGQKSYIGILLQLLAGNPDVILLDEAEAFLHPPLARKLGGLISKIAKETNKQVFLSTHSPNIVMGAIQSGAKTNIIRLSYDGTDGRTTMIDSKKLNAIMCHPLIRSTSFLDALFYKHAVVTESDSDRAFYQEINYRLSKFKPGFAIEDCIFLNAQNKQTVGTIVKELRLLGVPTASIVDFDFIREGGKQFTDKYLKSVNIPSSMHPTISASRDTLNTYFKNFNDEYKTLKSQGVVNLETGLYATAELMIKTLNNYGQFPVPVGELECWLPKIESYNHGSTWLIKKFEELGFDESSDSYVKPENDDVWEFINNINLWLTNSNRMGMISSQQD